MKKAMRSLRLSQKRPAVALMVTVAIMALIAVIILGNLKLLDDAMIQSREARQLNQDQALLQSFITLLKKESEGIDSPSALDAFLVTLPTIKDDKGFLELGISIDSLQGKININAIFDEDNNSVAPAYERMFIEIFEKYELKEPHTLLALIADTIDSDTIERYGESELINRYADMSQGMIASSDHLQKISAYYDAMFEDSRVYQIPWDRFFRYGKPYISESLDCNHLDRELALFMGLKVSGSGAKHVACSEIAKDQNQTKKDFHIEAFSQDKPYYVEVKSRYETQALKGNFSFIYELKNKEISHLRSF